MTSRDPAFAFRDLVPLLICRDVPGSVTFYTEVLGFEVLDRMNDVGATGFATVGSGPARIMLASPTYMPEAPRVDGRYPQAACYLYVDDVAALRRRVVEADWPATDCVDRFYGLREFEVVDPEGHVLLFGQDIEVTDPPTGPPSA